MGFFKKFLNKFHHEDGTNTTAGTESTSSSGKKHHLFHRHDKDEAMKQQSSQQSMEQSRPHSQQMHGSNDKIVRDKLEDIIRSIQDNRIMEVFEKYYHEDVIMYENGDSTNRVGKEQNRAAELAFTQNAVIHEAKANKIMVDGNNTAYEMFMDFTYGEHRVQKTQWAFQEWKDGLIIKEEFLSPAAPTAQV